MNVFEMQARVYYEDTDAAGVVYYANYLKFAERARTECLRQMGFENGCLQRDHGLAFVVRHLEADYRAPARLDDLLLVRTSLTGLKKARFVMRQTIFRQDEKNPPDHSPQDALFDMQVTLACIKLSSGLPAGLPAPIYDVFKKSAVL